MVGRPSLLVAAALASCRLTPADHVLRRATTTTAGWIDVACGRDLCCGLKAVDGSITCWDDLGPFQTVGHGFVEIDAAHQTVCGTDGESTDCWLQPVVGGQGSRRRLEPLHKDLPMGSISVGWEERITTDLWHGADLVCGVPRGGGQATCEFGDPEVPPVSSPSEDYESVAVGGNPRGVCGLRADGTVNCWYGAVDPDPGSVYARIEGGEYGFCGLTTSGGLECWGLWADVYPLPIGSFIDLSMKDRDVDSAVVRGDGTIETWGDEDTYYDDPPDDRYTRVELWDDYHGLCGVTRDGFIRCVGASGGADPVLP